ncbi:hypothetical protein PILCRDRAFT_711678 [Piloderma croceum F 1598]|uniref:Uncharacterized protein n=1 Tax=Piloderma croceum (strain F 1598) TaxID=765440 RepID=A0A0C3F2S4_PILCF|nr:hypothetical protein PILCRDRAFT_711678 [Piloderma croceum F 1598]
MGWKRVERRFCVEGCWVVCWSTFVLWFVIFQQNINQLPEWRTRHVGLMCDPGLSKVDYIRSIHQLSISSIVHYYCVTESADGDFPVWASLETLRRQTRVPVWRCVSTQSSTRNSPFRA